MKQYKAEDHTFVICAYKESPYLEDCIRSVLHQNVRGKICLTTSTPNQYIAALAQKYQIPVFANPVSEGIAADWNFAVASAKTRLVTLAHQDDLYEPSYTEKIIQAANICQDPIILFSDYWELRGDQKSQSSSVMKVKHLMLLPLRVRHFWRSRFVRRRILSMGNAICCTAVTLVRNAVPLPVFQNNMKSNIDWQAWELISRQKGEFAYIAKPLMCHRIHEHSTTSELLEVHGRQEEDLFMFRKFWPEPVARLISLLYKNREKSNKSM